MVLLLPSLLFSSNKKTVTRGGNGFFVQSFFKNRPSPSPYVEGNNNPADNRDLYGADAGSDCVHTCPSKKLAFQ
jgi:hypothetical protein